MEINESKLASFNCQLGQYSYIDDANYRERWTKDNLFIGVKQVQKLHARAHVPSVFMAYSEGSITGVGTGPLKYFCEDPVIVEKFKQYLYSIVDGVLEDPGNDVNKSFHGDNVKVHFHGDNTVNFPSNSIHDDDEIATDGGESGGDLVIEDDTGIAVSEIDATATASALENSLNVEEIQNAFNEIQENDGVEKTSCEIVETTSNEIHVVDDNIFEMKVIDKAGVISLDTKTNLITNWTPLLITSTSQIKDDNSGSGEETDDGDGKRISLDIVVDDLFTFVYGSSWAEAVKFIQRYECETKTKYSIFLKLGTFNSMHIDITNHKIQFEDIKEKGRQQCIKYSGVPFVILGCKKLECAHGRDRNISVKKRRFDNEEIKKKMIGEMYQRRRSSTKKVGCPSTIVVRDVVFFPQFTCTKDTRWCRSEVSKNLREKFHNDEKSVVTERRFYVRLPPLNSHFAHT